jgi:serine/threonine protein kinase
MQINLFGNGQNNSNPKKQNFSQNDPEELVSYVVNKEEFLIPRKYSKRFLQLILEIFSVLGAGAYGIVLKGQDTTKDNMDVAIKKNRNIFPPNQTLDQQNGRKLIELRILRELKVLTHLNHDNIVGLVDVIRPHSIDELNDVYYVFEFVDTNLGQVIKSKQKLSDQHIQTIMYQILLGLNYMHSADILHRDLKPDNILINAKCEVKICDMGLARGIDFKNDPTQSTNFIQTRYYRAPEMLLDYPTVSKQVDMWSIGCIFAELILGHHLFPGSSPLDQLRRIVAFVGTPDIRLIPGDQNVIGNVFKDFEFSKGVDLKYFFPKGTNLLGLDLLSRMLTFDPNKRIDTLQALKHKYFENLYSGGHIKKAQPFDSRFEDDAEMSSVKTVLYNTLCDFKTRNYGGLFSEEEQMELQSPIHNLMQGFCNDKRHNPFQ